MPERSTILLSNNENGDETRVDLGVLEVILGIAAKKVDGVNEMRGSLKSSIDKIFGRSNQGKGVSLTNRNGNLIADVYAYFDYGVNVPKVALELQKQLGLQLEQMTNLKLVETNIHVVGLISEDDKNNTKVEYKEVKN